MNIHKMMLIVIAVSFILAGGCTSNLDQPEEPLVQPILDIYPELMQQPYSIDQVERVVDGDTFVISSGDRIRLIGVNTPESVKPGSPVETFAKEASAFAKSELSGKTVALFQDAEDEDRYGRKLRYVFILDSKTSPPVMFNELLVSEGFANPMTISPNVMFSERFVDLERRAREQNKGLWAETPIPQLSCKSPQIKGNINSKGEKIYHMPEGRYYEVTIAEEMFCTEEEALSAGYRKSKQ